MKKRTQSLFQLFAVIVFLMGCNNKQVKSQGKSDTTIIARYKEEDYHVVFEDRKGSSFYEGILKGVEVDTFQYNRVLQEIKDSFNISIKRFSLPLKREWVSLNVYKDKYYAYAPSEPWVNLHFAFTDSTVIINFFNDGYIPSIIQSITNKDGSIVLNIKALYYYDDEYSKIIVHFLLKQKDIAIIAFPLKQGEGRYHLVGAKEKIRSFPIIVNYCPGRRCAEWQFEKPDYKMLLSKGVVKGL
ncbi:MAG TPA: hypothetical protein VF622_13585 [Segetibacter sp.]|jgi:uncharacterized lipoprotein NlpE involved in copper resistance